MTAPAPTPQVVCLGELIVDLISVEPGVPLWAVERFQKRAGGSAANVAVGLRHHGVEVLLWSKVGGDSFGRFLLARMAAHGVPTAGVAVDARYRTALALVGLGDDGDRHFEMHNTDSADQHLRPDEVDAAALDACRIFHFGGVALLGAETYATLRTLLPRARAADCLVSFDPNIQIAESTIAGPVILERLHGVLPFVDLLKMSVDDGDDLLPGYTPADLLALGPRLLVLTDGARGARLATAAHDIHIPAEVVDVVDAIGAGDAFTAALLARLAPLPPSAVRHGPTAADLRAWGAWATAWAARIIQHPGAVGGYGG